MAKLIISSKIMQRLILRKQMESHVNILQHQAAGHHKIILKMKIEILRFKNRYRRLVPSQKASKTPGCGQYLPQINIKLGILAKYS